MQRTCQSCKQEFVIEAEDCGFYEKMGVSTPNICPSCRAQKRLSFRNERVFYRRPCDKCKKDSVSMFSPNKVYTVCCVGCWFSRDWDASEYRIQYDPEKSFFEQWKTIWDHVPKAALLFNTSINCDYTNLCTENKNCYMIIQSSNNEDCIHSYWIQKCRDCVDTSFVHGVELSYESDDCYNCYRVSSHSSIPMLV